MINLKQEAQNLLAMRKIIIEYLEIMLDRSSTNVDCFSAICDIVEIENMALALRFLLLYEKSLDNLTENNQSQDNMTNSSYFKTTATILNKLEQQITLNKHRFSLNTWSIVLESLTEAADL